MNAVLAADYDSAVRRDGRPRFLLSLAMSCSVHVLALTAALTLYAERQSVSPPDVSDPPPIVARVMTESAAEAAMPQASRDTKAPAVVRSEPPAQRARKSIAPVPPMANVRQLSMPEPLADSPVSEPAHSEEVPQRTSAGAPAVSMTETAQTVGDPVVPPSFKADYLDNPAPAYPPASRRLREQGRVLLLVDVAPDGVPQQVNLATSSGSARLDEAALEAVRRWRFIPARKGTTAVPAQVLVPIVFALTG